MEQEKGVSFGKVMKVAFGRWWLVTAITVGVAAAGSAAMLAGYNKLKGDYVSSFSYNSSDLKEELFADGSNFFYKNIASKDNLERAKATSDKFNSIDVDNIFAKNAIGISRENESTSDKEKLYTYTLVVAKKYFANGEQAANFIKEVASYPIIKDRDIVDVNNFNYSLVLFDGSDSFTEQLSYLEGLGNSLDGSYTNLQDTYSLNSSTKSVIDSNIIEINSILGDKDSNGKRSVIEQLRYAISENGFVKDYNSKEVQSFELTKKTLLEEKSLNQTKIAALEAEIATIGVTAADALTTSLDVLVKRNVDIDYKVASINKMIANEGNTDPAYLAAYDEFVKTLDSYREKLEGATQSYVSVLDKLFIQDASVSFVNTSVVIVKGNISTPLAVIGSILVGLIIGMIVDLIVDRKKLKEE